jgi:hypothetical protein
LAPYIPDVQYGQSLLIKSEPKIIRFEWELPRIVWGQFVNFFRLFLVFVWVRQYRVNS